MTRPRSRLPRITAETPVSSEAAGAFLFQLTEDKIGVDRIFRVTEAPSRIAEPDLSDPRFHAEAELVVNALRAPALDPILVGSRPPQGFDFGMAVEYAIGDAVDPVAPVADFAVGHTGEIRSQGPADVRNICSTVSSGMLPTSSNSPAIVYRPQSWRVASLAPATSASSLAQAICG